MRVVRTIADLRALLRPLRQEGKRIGFVPTMGFLHEGHDSLIRQSAARCDSTVVSIFVNPTQFGPGEDLANYPRDLERDQNLCLEAGATVLFLPEVAEIYPTGFQTHVEPGRLADTLCGRFRPGHFRGVTTVVAKLFSIVQPDVAVFGAKDYQQAAIVKRMVRDLNFPVKVLVAPTYRERDGLAMSSRNQYLSPAERQQATVLSGAIQLARRMVRSASRGCPATRLQKALTALISQHPAARVDYISVFDPVTLKPVAKAQRGSHLAMAVLIGRTRLIDNGEL